MINRVEPKVVGPDRPRAGRYRSERFWPGPLRVHHALQHGAVRQQRPAAGAEIRDQPPGNGRQDPARLRLDRQRLPDQRRLSAVFDDIEQRTYDPDKAAVHYKKSGHDGSRIMLRTVDGAFPGAVDAAQLFQQIAPRPLASRSRSSANRTTATGRKSGTCSRSAPPTGAAVRFRTRCIPPPICRPQTGTTPGSSTRRVRRHADRGAGRTGRGQAQANLLARWAMMRARRRRPDLPMFNDFIDATGPRCRRLGQGSERRHDEQLRDRQVLAGRS